MAKSRKFSADRRKFLKGAAVAGAATLAAPGKSAVAAPAARGAGRTPPQDPRAETGTLPEVDVLTTDHCGSDFMVDVIKSLEIDYICANPGSSFRALHESIINYGGDQKPQFITSCHQETSVGIAPRYFKKKSETPRRLAPWALRFEHTPLGIYKTPIAP